MYRYLFRCQKREKWRYIRVYDVSDLLCLRCHDSKLLGYKKKMYSKKRGAIFLPVMLESFDIKAKGGGDGVNVFTVDSL
jgi:hypothetical protein